MYGSVFVRIFVFSVGVICERLMGLDMVVVLVGNG